MKNTTLVLFALLVSLGWTSLAAGVIAALAGQPEVSMRKHSHERPSQPVPVEPLYVGGPCPAGAQAQGPSVHCDV